MILETLLVSISYPCSFIIIFIRILCSPCLFFLHDFHLYSHVFHSSLSSWTRCSWPFFKLTFFFSFSLKRDWKALWELMLKCGGARMLRSIPILILTTAGSYKILFPFLQFHTLILHNYLWSQEYIITLAYCYVLVSVHLSAYTLFL